MIKGFNLEIPSSIRCTTTKDILHFWSGGEKNCEISVDEGKATAGARSCYASTVKRLRLSEQIRVIQRSDRLFLERKDV